ncbi:mitotic spindle assembly checkpoint protein MAD1-like [Physella acuta]|uniref:mitotic spindle assembly checkpoint protein MAD1-like n=1 Tax=Physella acuta TaxID=109671 RepID=UPI0027DE8147|nr:mitotic spindle assembly checkpoint protein MAD1-like [Physella acuta]
MDSFVDNTEVIRMKRKFDSSISDRSSREFGNVRHNLLADFGDTPLKSARLTSHDSGKSNLFSNVSASSLNESGVLKKDLALKESEIIALKANIVHYENRLCSLENSLRQAQIENERELAKVKTERDKESAKSSELRSKIHFVMEKEKNSRDEIVKLESELQKQKIEADKKLLAAQMDKIEAIDQLQQVKASKLQAESDFHIKFLMQMQEISTLKSKVNEAEAQLELRKRTQYENSDYRKEVEELKMVLKEEQQKKQELEKWMCEHEDNILITKAMKSDLDLVPFMKNELEKLRTDNEILRHNEQNTLLLEEEVRSLKNKLEYAESIACRVTELEVLNEELQGRLYRWEASDTSGSRRPQSPCSLSRRIQELETIQANLVINQGELQSEINLTQRRLEQANTEKQKLLLELAEVTNRDSQQNEHIKRLKRKTLLLAKERDSYKNLLDSYESEVTVNFDNERKSQVLHLEELVHDYKQQNAELEAEMNSLSDKFMDAQAKYDQVQQQLLILGPSGQQQTSKESQDLIKKLQEQVAELETTLSKVQEEKDILEARIEQRNLQGDYDPSKIKVIHFNLNPSAVASNARQEEMTKIKEENDKLRKRNQILEEQGKVEDITLQVQEKLQHPSPSKEIKEMKEKLKIEEMRNKRLKEVFTKTSQEMREICYQLTGYKIDIPVPNQYRVMSMYAESSRDYLLFQQNEKGEIQLLQTDFSLTLQDAMEMYLIRQNSFPMFLSHITMDLFSKQTMNFG